MKRLLKKSLAFILALTMVFGVAPLAGLVGLELPSLKDVFADKAEAATITDYKQGDIIEFGWYPQTEETDPNTISILNSAGGEWKSYGYYSGTGAKDDGRMTPGNYMRYKDVIFKSNKYRGVIFDSYRPNYTGHTSWLTNQDHNGYTLNNVYWFKYEPIRWRVLDPNTGMLMSEMIIDAQAYNNYFFRSGTDEYGDDAYWGDPQKNLLCQQLCKE